MNTEKILTSVLVLLLLQVAASQSTGCPAGYYSVGPFTNVTNCVYCNIPGCIGCVDSSTATSCQRGYYLSSTAKSIGCTACQPQGCSSCSSTGQCTSCEVGSFLNSTYGCSACTTAFCATCNSTACTECESGYYLNNGACSACGPQCTSCNSAGQCTGCIYGYYPSNGTCTACNANCPFSCSSASQCSICYAGQCSLGPSNCAKWSGPGQCTKCFSGAFYSDGNGNCPPNGYYATTNGQFAACDAGCTQCTGTGAGNCQTCNSVGYYLSNTTNLCTTCPSSLGCVGCMNWNGGVYCQYNSCAPGYTYNNPYCTPTCQANCATCSGATTCTTCQQGYYLSSAGTCIACNSNCTTCSNATTCLSCQPGHYSDGNGNCFACDAGCSVCTGTGANNCQTCAINAVMNPTSNLCTLCAPIQCSQCYWYVPSKVTATNAPRASCYSNTCNPGTTYNSTSGACA